jgi:hypothetical protein
MFKHLDTEQTMNQCLIKGIGGIIKNSENQLKMKTKLARTFGIQSQRRKFVGDVYILKNLRDFQ